MHFVGDRLRLARALRDLTQEELGQKVAASAPYISQLETEKRDPSDTLLEALSTVLGFEVEFFATPIEDEFTEEECNFRRKAAAPASAKKRVLAQGTLLGELVSYLESVLEFPAENVPEIQVDGPESIELAADGCRDLWGLGRDTPILNIGRVLERAGVLLLEHDAQSDAIDAFSRSGQRLAVLMNTSKGSPSRMRFNLAHEMGHLVMHRNARANRKQKEEEANRFAGAFLLPRRAFSQEFPRGRFDWEALFRLKGRWGASVACMIRRAYDLNIIDAARYRTAYKYMSMRKWTKEEPYEVSPTRPELLANAFSALKEIGTSPRETARSLFWKPATLKELAGIDTGDAPLTLVRS